MFGLLIFLVQLQLEAALSGGGPSIRTIHKMLAHVRSPAHLRGGSACSVPGTAPICDRTPAACPAGEVTASCQPTVSNNSSGGSGGGDCGPQLQQAFDSCCPLVKIPALPSNMPWVTNSSLCIRSNTKVLFFPGATIVAARGGFKNYVAPLFWIAGSTLATSNISNVTIVGYGAKWKMWKEDYDTPTLGYVHSEARPGLYMYRCTNCSVFGLTVADSGGDGMEIVGSKDVLIKDVVLDNNYRQGMSVVGIEDMLVESSIFSNTGQQFGTPPMAGVDIEPDDTGCSVNKCSVATINLTFRNCRSINNVGGGYDIGLKYNDASTYAPPKRPLSIHFDNCSVEGAGGTTSPLFPTDVCPLGGGYQVDGPMTGTRGKVVIRNSIVEHTAHAGIELRNVGPTGDFDVSFENVQLRQVATATTCRQGPCSRSCRSCWNATCHANVSTAPVTTSFIPLPGYACCAAEFRNVTVVDNVYRPFLFLDEAGACDPGWGVDLCLTSWRNEQWDYKGSANDGKGHFGYPTNVLNGDIAVTNPKRNIGCKVGRTNGTQAPPASLHVNCVAVAPEVPTTDFE